MAQPDRQPVFSVCCPPGPREVLVTVEGAGDLLLAPLAWLAGRTSASA